MLTAGPVHYEVGANVDATCFGGIAALHRLVTRLGLPAAIDADLELLKVHLPYHESDHVLITGRVASDATSEGIRQIA